MTSFDLYFLGGEQPGWRKLLDECGVETLGVSFWGLARRLPKRKTISVADWGFERVMLDSGGFSANKVDGAKRLTVGEAEEYALTYRAFVEANLDDLEIVSEFDFLALGPAWREKQRAEFWNHIDPDQFLPMWHPDQGLDALDQLSERYPRIGVSEASLDGKLNITPRLNALARRGTLLHGVATTKQEVLKSINFTSAASTSWLSPMRYGETIVWDNNRLHHYPKKMKVQARLRHKMAIEAAGFDMEAIDRDDANTVAKLSVWSWLQFRDALRASRGNPEAEEGEVPETGTALEEVGTTRPSMRNSVPTIERETVPLPTMAFSTVPAMNQDTGEMGERVLPGVSSATKRVCNGCYVKDKCDAYQPDNACAYSIPLEIRTKDQRAAFLNGMLELQGQRLLFNSFVEQLNGGYPDPNLSQEYDRMLKTMQVQAELEDGRDFLKINIEGRGQNMGAISRLFGKAPESPELPVQLDGLETDLAMGRVLEGRTVVAKR